MQSAWVPVCSSAEDWSLAPPIPTQNAEYVWPEPHLAVGWTQLPDTFENCVPPAAYPAQFWLTADCTAVAADAVAVAAVTTARAVAVEATAKEAKRRCRFMPPLSAAPVRVREELTKSALCTCEEPIKCLHIVPAPFPRHPPPGTRHPAPGTRHPKFPPLANVGALLDGFLVCGTKSPELAAA